MQNDSMSYMMLFCALVVARKRGIPLQEALLVTPVSGRTNLLAGMLLEPKAVSP